jgi:preprotein translocase subunit SecB
MNIMVTTAEKKIAKDSGYAAFIASLHLYSIGLAESSCSIDRDEYWGKDEEKSVSYKMMSKPLALQEKTFDARSSLTLTITGEKSKAAIVKIVVTFELHFHASPITKELVDKFCESEIRLIVWPYFREYVSNTIGRMHIPPVILPLSDKEE